MLNDFPEYALQERGIQVEVSEAPPADQRGACFVWIGPACSSFARDEAGSDLRPECAAWGDLIPAGGDSEFTASHEAEFHRLPPRVQMGLFRCR